MCSATNTTTALIGFFQVLRGLGFVFLFSTSTVKQEGFDNINTKGIFLSIFMTLLGLLLLIDVYCIENSGWNLVLTAVQSFCLIIFIIDLMIVVWSKHPKTYLQKFEGHALVTIAIYIFCCLG